MYSFPKVVVVVVPRVWSFAGSFAVFFLEVWGFDFWLFVIACCLGLISLVVFHGFSMAVFVLFRMVQCCGIFSVAVMMFSHDVLGFS